MFSCLFFFGGLERIGVVVNRSWLPSKAILWSHSPASSFFLFRLRSASLCCMTLFLRTFFVTRWIEKGGHFYVHCWGNQKKREKKGEEGRTTTTTERKAAGSSKVPLFCFFFFFLLWLLLLLLLLPLSVFSNTCYRIVVGCDMSQLTFFFFFPSLATRSSLFFFFLLHEYK